jgi:hypothetical protein
MKIYWCRGLCCNPASTAVKAPIGSVSLSGGFEFELLTDKLDRLGQSRDAETEGALDAAGLATPATLAASARSDCPSSPPMDRDDAGRVASPSGRATGDQHRAEPGAGAEAGLGYGSFAGVGPAVVHVQLRLLIGDVFAGHGEVSSGQLRTSPFRQPSRSRRRIPCSGTALTRGPAYGRATPNLRPTPPSSIQIDAQTILIVAAHPLQV